MSRPALPPELPEATVAGLHALYREAADAEPGPELDRSILDAAHAGLDAAGAAKSRRPAPRWKGWLMAASALALAGIGVSLTWRVMDEQERQWREDARTPPLRRETSGGAAKAEASVPGAPAPAPAAARAPEVPAAALKGGHAELTRPVDAPARAQEAATLQAAPVPFAAPAAPQVLQAPAAEAMKKSVRTEADEPRERREATVGSNAASARGKLDAASPATGVAGATADSLAQPGVDAATPEAWLKRIRELVAAGRRDEAAQSLARFRLRYPDFVVPDDLRGTK
jgi:hypothetical protein